MKNKEAINWESYWKKLSENLKDYDAIKIVRLTLPPYYIDKCVKIRNNNLQD
ncbi:MAG TPA: hypothetical protein VIP29_02720 [Nitrososphaeraceae archaeon]